MKAVFFDIDDTVYSYKKAHEVAFSEVLRYAERELGMGAEEFQNLFKKKFQEIKAEMGSCAAIHNRLIRFQRMLEERHLSLCHAAILDKLYWNTLLEAMAPEPGIREAMARLKAQGCLVGIGTNMTAAWQFAKLEKLGLLDLVDVLVSSEETCAEKPDSRFYELCIRKAGVPASECLFIGDSLEGDYLGPRSAGMHALLYAPEGCTDTHIHYILHFNQLQNLESML